MVSPSSPDEALVAIASQETSHIPSCSANRYLELLMPPPKFPDIPISLWGNTEVPSTNSSEPLLPPDCDRRAYSPALYGRGSPLPPAPQDEAGLKRKFES